MLTANYTKRLASVVKWMFPLLLAVVLLFGSAGCGKSGAQETKAPQTEATTAVFELIETAAEAAEETLQEQASEGQRPDEPAVTESAAEAEEPEETDEPEEQAEPETTEAFTQAEAPETEASVTEDGEYTSKEEVAEYIHLYGHLPDNFITKKEAKALGWEGGDSLGRLAPGKSIGGDRFGNYEGQLPDRKGRKYTECDIDYKGKKRNAKRIIFSNDGLIFYTEDHYKTFEQLY